MKQLASDIKELVTDEEVDTAFSGTNFGVMRDHRQIIADTLLKVAGDYCSGHTAMSCCRYLGLIGKSNRPARLTRKGRRYLFWAFHGALEVRK